MSQNARGREVTVRQDHADTGFLEHIGGKSRNKQVARIEHVELVLLNAQHADVITTGTTRQLPAEIDVHGFSATGKANASREKRPAALEFHAGCRRSRLEVVATANKSELEYVRVLQEKRPLLGKEQTESRQVDLAGIDTGSGEVGIDGERAGQRRRDLVKQIERGLGYGR